MVDFVSMLAKAKMKDIVTIVTKYKNNEFGDDPEISAPIAMTEIIKTLGM